MQIFAEQNLNQYLEQCKNKIKEEVYNEERNHLLNVDEETYMEYLVNKYTLEPLDFNWDAVTVTDNEKYISPEKAPAEFIFRMGLGNKSYKKQVITYHVPFTGHHILLRMQPSQRRLWTDEIELNLKNQQEISFHIVDWNENPEEIKSFASNVIENIKSQSEYVCQEVQFYNSEIKPLVSKFVLNRKTELLR